MFYGTTEALLPEDARAAVPFLIPIGAVALWRWGLYLIRIVLWLLYRPIKPKKNPDGTSANRYKSSDVTIVVPTIDNGPETIEAAKRWLRNEPKEVIIVTSDEMKDELTKTFMAIDPNMFRVLSVSRPNKRVQLMKGIWEVQTPLAALSDDDALWTDEFLEWSLAPFDDERMGGVGSKQEMMPVGDKPTAWEVIADFRLSMRMIEASATTFVDGGISCLSGRTAVYKTEILQDAEKFEPAFINEKWLGKYSLHSGDDKFITRWLVKSNYWKMHLQNHRKCMLYTTFKPNVSFLTKQVVRWTRNTWRSDIRSIFVDHSILYRYPYVAFNMFDKFINPLPIIYSITVILYNIFDRGFVMAMSHVFVPVFAMLLLSRVLKLVPHLLEKPSHFWFIPAMVGFQYIFTMYKIYALFTLHITDWGSRANVDHEEDKEIFHEEVSVDGEGCQRSKVQLLSVPMNAANVDDDASFDTAETSEKSDVESGTVADTNISGEEQKKPQAKGRTFVVGFLFLSIALVCITSLISRYCGQTIWTMTEISNIHSVSADRGTGAGVYDETHDKTFITFAGPGMDPMVLEYDHARGKFVREPIPVAKAPELHDFHDYPRMVMDRDGHLVIVWTDSPDSLFMARATKPHTTEGPWTSKKINDDKATYPCLTKASNGDLYSFYRHSNTERSIYPESSSEWTHVNSDYRPLHYVKSTDNGETWTEPIVAIDTGGLSNNGDPRNLNEIYADCPRHEPSHDGIPERFMFGWTLSGGGYGMSMHNLYHKDAHFAYFYPATAHFENAAGQDLGDLIDYDGIKACVVFDSGPLDETNKRPVDYYFAPSYFSDMYAGMGPLIVYNHRNTLMVSKWTGSSWSHAKVHQENAAYNLIDIEKIGHNSFEVYHSEGDIKVFRSIDGGQVWKLQRPLIVPKAGRVTKAIKIHHSHPDIELVALENVYSDWFGSNYEGTNRVWVVGKNGTINQGVDDGVNFAAIAAGVSAVVIMIVLILLAVWRKRLRKKDPGYGPISPLFPLNVLCMASAAAKYSAHDEDDEGYLDFLAFLSEGYLDFLAFLSTPSTPNVSPDEVIEKTEFDDESEKAEFDDEVEKGGEEIIAGRYLAIDRGVDEAAAAEAFLKESEKQRKVEEEEEAARMKSEEEAARVKAEEEAQLKAEEAAAPLKVAAEAEEEAARVKAAAAAEEEEEEAARANAVAAEEEARLKAEEEASQARLAAVAEEEARLEAEAEAQARAEEEARLADLATAAEEQRLLEDQAEVVKAEVRKEDNELLVEENAVGVDE